MQSHLKVSALVAAAMFASAVSALAQTGEFASPVPGSVVHAGYALQDWWQNARRPVNWPAEAVQEPRPRHSGVARRHQDK